MSSEVSLAEGKLEQRTVFLTQLIMGMDICIGEIKRLYDGYAYFHKVGLKESDLVMKRGSLSNTVSQINFGAIVLYFFITNNFV
jgi:hypothetical protein